MKARLAAGETLFGTFLTLGWPLAAESLGLAGFDWLLVDLEHGGGDESQLLGQLLGARAAGVHALVRVESDVRGRTARALDLGVEGVMCPQVNSAEPAEAWARALHYGPAGSRGIAFFHRGARFGTDPDPIGAARERTLGHRADRVARGGRGRRGDRRRRRASTCSSSARATSRTRWGIFRQFEDPRFRSAIERVVAAADAAGKTAGIFLTAVDQIAPALADGFRMIAIGSDGGFMMQAAAHSSRRCASSR